MWKEIWGNNTLMMVLAKWNIPERNDLRMFKKTLHLYFDLTT